VSVQLPCQILILDLATRFFLVFLLTPVFIAWQIGPTPYEMSRGSSAHYRLAPHVIRRISSPKSTDRRHLAHPQNCDSLHSGDVKAPFQSQGYDYLDTRLALSSGQRLRQLTSCSRSLVDSDLCRPHDAKPALCFCQPFDLTPTPPDTHDFSSRSRRG
jgi:hypothetical protein